MNPGYTALIAEDESPLRELMRAVLSKERFHVMAAADGREALSRAAKCRSPIHLLVTDVVMPNMDGMELSDHLRAERPEMKVLYVSGACDPWLLHSRLQLQGTAFLSKPFTPATLLEAVWALLENNGAGDERPARVASRTVQMKPSRPMSEFRLHMLAGYHLLHLREFRAGLRNMAAGAAFQTNFCQDTDGPRQVLANKPSRAAARQSAPRVFTAPSIDGLRIRVPSHGLS